MNSTHMPNPISFPYVIFPDGSRFPLLTGGDGGGAPPPNYELERKQAELIDFQLRQAKEQEKLFKGAMPLLAEQQGLKFDEVTGKYSYLDPTQQSNKREIERLTTARSLSALKGELPVSATLKKELELQGNQLREKLYRQLGPGYEESTPGVLAMNEFKRMATQLKEDEQYGRLTTTEALNTGRQNMRAGQTASTASALNAPYTASLSAGESVGRILNPALSYDMGNRQLGLQSKAMQGQETAGYASAGIGAMGLLAGLAAFSDPELKTDIEDVSDAELLKAVEKIPVKKWRYKADPEKTVMVGGMAPDMPREVSPTGKHYNVVSYLGMLTGAVRELNKKISEREESRLSPASALAF